MGPKIVAILFNPNLLFISIQNINSINCINDMNIKKIPLFYILNFVIFIDQ